MLGELKVGDVGMKGEGEVKVKQNLRQLHRRFNGIQSFIPMFVAYLLSESHSQLSCDHVDMLSFDRIIPHIEMCIPRVRVPELIYG